MPLWKINHSPNVFTDKAEKQAIAQAVTDWYVSRGLPDYYVNVQFLAVSAENFYTAASSITHTVLVEILHIARHWDPKDKEKALGMKASIDKILKPYTMDRGLHLEYAIMESPAGLWRINGIDPPEAFGPDEQEKAATNRKRLDELRQKAQ